MGEIRDRITWPDDREYDEHALGSEWAAGNLIPADEAQARIDAAVEAERERCAKIVEGRPAGDGYLSNYITWPEWGPWNRSNELSNPIVSFSRSIAAAIREPNEMTWEDRLCLLRKRLGRQPSLDEMLIEAKKHKMTPGEVDAQRESWVRGHMPIGDPRFD